ncbi:MAG: PAS domain S-box protein [Veillonellaceae bacterium]|nr:PAS domain S-box protein [Veillonellaceae bacterium]
MKRRKGGDYGADCCSERYALLYELSSIVEQATNGIIRTDPDFNITYMNRAAEELTGYTLAEVGGRKPDIFGARLLNEEESRQRYESIRQAGRTEWEFVNRRKTGGEYIVKAAIFPLRNDAGDLLGYVEFHQDISERKKIEQELREREELYHALMMQSHDAIALLDTETLNPVEVNPRFEELTGYRRPAAAMLEVLDLFDDSRENKLKYFQRLMRDGMLPSTVRPLRARDGRRLYVERAATLVKVAERSYLLINLRDITEEMIRRREMEQELALATQVQQALLSEVPQAAEFAIETLFAPAGFVSGDLYHLEWYEPIRTLRGYLLDITGHGLASALQTAAVNVLLHEVMDLPEKLSVSGQLEWLNQRIFRYIDETSFAAAIAFEIDFTRGRLCYASAGITDFLLNWERISTPGLFLGIDRKERYETSYLPFAAGDTVCFMTDGITDVLTSEERWGKVTARDICGRFRGKRQANRLKDDATALCITATGRRGHANDHGE